MLDYLARAGISKEQVARDGYLIRTTLDPRVQDSVKHAIDGIASPTLDGVADVMSVIKPGKGSHQVLAMASNRTYGLNMEAGETMQPQPFSLVGDGAGSIFKIFTTAAALDMGMGINAQLEVPGRFEAKGMGTGGARGCPKETWCVLNDGYYRGAMNVTEALATSPNTAFARLIQLVGVPRAVDMAVKLGLRSYAQPGTARAYDPQSNESLADFVKRQNLGSFTLGPIELNPLELSNVAATLASGGVWCPPSPIDKIFDRKGDEVAVTTETCEQVVPGGPGEHPRERAEQGHHQRHRGGFGRFRGLEPADVGQDRNHRGAPVVGVRGLHQQLRRGRHTSSTTRPTPPTCARSRCASADPGTCTAVMSRPALGSTAMKPIANDFGDVKLPPTDPRYVDGGPGSRVPSVSGLTVESAKQRLRDAGFGVADQATPVNSTSPAGTVIGTTPSGQTVPGAIVMVNTSNGIAPAPPPPPPGAPPPVVGSTVVEIPGLPPITVPVLGPPPPPEPPPP